MSNVQFDYSTLSTSISRSELSAIIGRNVSEQFYDVNEDEEESSEKSSSTSSEVYVHPPPPDRYKLVYLVFGLLGIGTLLPWNFFITANDYWMYKFRHTANKSCIDPRNKTDLQASFTSYLTLSNNVPYVIFLVLCTVFINRFPKSFRVVWPLMTLFILFAIITAFVEIDTDTWQMSFFAITMLLVVAISTTSAVLQAGVAAIASLLPSEYMHAMVLGQAIAGIFASVVQALSLLGNCDSIKSALIYFFCADTVMIFTLVSYIAIQKSEFFKYYVCSLKDTMLKDVGESEVKTRIRISIIVILKVIWPYALSILLDFWVTIGVFPSLTVLVVSENQHGIWGGKLYLPLACFLLFNVSDFCGRIVGGSLPFPPSWKMVLLGLCSLRIVFIPLFMLCNAYPRYHSSVVFYNDIYFIVFITLLGFTNGYFVAVAMVAGIKSVNPLLQEMAGVILATSLAAGLMLGSLSSYIFIKLI